MYIQKTVNSINIIFILLSDNYQKESFNTQNVNQLTSQVDMQIDAQFDTQVDTQVAKQNDKRETIEIDSKRDDSQKSVRIIEMNAVKVFHQIVNTYLTSSQNDFQFMRKSLLNADINEHNTSRLTEREDANVNIENVFHCSFILIAHNSTSNSMSKLNSRLCLWKRLLQVQTVLISLKKYFQILCKTKRLLHDLSSSCLITNRFLRSQIRTKTSYRRKTKSLAFTSSERLSSRITCLMICRMMKHFKWNRRWESLHLSSKKFERLSQTTTKLV